MRPSELCPSCLPPLLRAGPQGHTSTLVSVEICLKPSRSFRPSRLPFRVESDTPNRGASWRGVAWRGVALVATRVARGVVWRGRVGSCEFPVDLALRVAGPLMAARRKRKRCHRSAANRPPSPPWLFRNKLVGRQTTSPGSDVTLRCPTQPVRWWSGGGRTLLPRAPQHAPRPQGPQGPPSPSTLSGYPVHGPPSRPVPVPPAAPGGSALRAPQADPGRSHLQPLAATCSWGPSLNAKT